MWRENKNFSTAFREIQRWQYNVRRYIDIYKDAQCSKFKI